MIISGKTDVFDRSGYLTIQRMIENEDEMKMTSEEGKSSLSLRLQKYMKLAGVDSILEIVNYVMSVIFTSLYAIDTYQEPSATVKSLEISIAFYFLADYFLNLYISDNKILFAFSTYAIVDYISVIPFLLVRFEAVSGTWAEILNFCQVLRYLSTYRLNRVLAKKGMEVARQYFKVSFTISATLLIFACAFQMVENWEISNQNRRIDEANEEARQEAIAKNEDPNSLEPTPELSLHQFHDMIYFMVVTISVVGYGDISPITDIGRFMVVMTVFMILSLLPKQYEDLHRLSSLTSKFARISYKRGRGDDKHIVIMGSALDPAFKTFLGELYHSDHGINDRHAIIMRSKIPSEDLSIWLRQNNLASKVLYLEGNALHKRDLKRCAAEHCTCVVILANKYSNDPVQEDYQNILLAFAIKRYVRAKNAREIRVCLQLIKPEHREIYFSALHNVPHRDQVLCVEEIKLQLLAKTCLCPGINTLVSCLITSNKPGLPKILEGRTDFSKNDWTDDYLMGIQNEIYRIPLNINGHFTGITFGTVSNLLYKEFGVNLFALEVKIMSRSKVFLNPSNYIIQARKYYGYVITENLPDVGLLHQFHIPSTVMRDVSFTEPSDRILASKKGQLFSDKTLGTTMDEEENMDNFENIMKSFYMNAKPQSLQSCTIANVEKFSYKIENHIIVCGFVPGIRHFLLPLRAKSLKQKRPVVIMTAERLPAEIWEQINRFQRIYVMQGSALKPQDLEKAGIHKAIAVVILSRKRENDGTESEGMYDADTIFQYKTVRHTNPKVRIITELASQNTIRYLTTSGSQPEYGYLVTEPFAAGEIYISAMLDTLMCQAFYNPGISNILRNFIMGNSNLSTRVKTYYQEINLHSSNLFLINIPESFHDKTYGKMYEDFTMEKGRIPIGLYRSELVRDSEKPFVFINPPPQLELDYRDKVFILSAKRPKDVDMNGHDEDGKSQNEFLKSKLYGDEGKRDSEMAAAINKISTELEKLEGDLKTFKSKLGSNDPKAKDETSLIHKMREILTQEFNQAFPSLSEYE